jgi:hypothetical protein
MAVHRVVDPSRKAASCGDQKTMSETVRRRRGSRLSTGASSRNSEDTPSIEELCFFICGVGESTASMTQHICKQQESSVYIVHVTPEQVGSKQCRLDLQVDVHADQGSLWSVRSTRGSLLVTC